MGASFAAITPAGTKEMFTERGFNDLANANAAALGIFYPLTLKVFLQQVNFANVKDLFADQGFGESYSGGIKGAITQRMYQGIMHCIDPKYINLKNGDSPDQYVVRKGSPEESFWQNNESLANLITIPDKTLYQGLFASDGIAAFAEGQAKSIVEGFKLQRYLDKKECIHTIYTNDRHPLKSTQHVKVDDVTDAATAIKLIETIRNICDAIEFSAQSQGGKFNAGGFADHIGHDRLCLLARPKLFNTIATINRLQAPEGGLAIPVDVVKVEDFGGCVPVITAGDVYAAGTVCVANDAAPTYALYQGHTRNESEVTLAADINGATHTDIYDQYGAKVADAYYLAGNIDGSHTTIYVPVESAKIMDPHADVLGAVADKGVIFFNVTNPMQVELARNARGLFTDMWLSSPDNAILYDHRKIWVSLDK